MGEGGGGDEEVYVGDAGYHGWRGDGEGGFGDVLVGWWVVVVEKYECERECACGSCEV